MLVYLLRNRGFIMKIVWFWHNISRIGHPSRYKELERVILYRDTAWNVTHVSYPFSLFILLLVFVTIEFRDEFIECVMLECKSTARIMASQVWTENTLL